MAQEPGTETEALHCALARPTMKTQCLLSAHPGCCLSAPVSGEQMTVLEKYNHITVKHKQIHFPLSTALQVP